MRHCLALTDFLSAEIREILALAAELKAGLAAGQRPPLLARHTLGLLFQKPSLRTRVSFESLASQLGANSLYLGEDVGWGSREPNRDFVPILTGYVDLLVIRAKRHADLEEVAKLSRCPVINGLTDWNHPCQALADILTVQELHRGTEVPNICYLGDANNVARSLAIICSRLDFPFSIGAPPGYQFDPAWVAELDRQSGGRVLQTADPAEAVRNADFVYTDVWTSMGQEAENAERLAALADYQVNESLLAGAAADVRFLHCLPARRGEEVTGGVIDSARSAVIDQAANRLHAQKGLVVWLAQQAGLGSTAG